MIKRFDEKVLFSDCVESEVRGEWWVSNSCCLRVISRTMSSACSMDPTCNVDLSHCIRISWVPYHFLGLVAFITWWRHQMKHFPRYWPFVRGIHRSPVNSPHKGQWRGALMFSLICVWINDWVNNREAGDLRHYRAHYDVIVMWVK